MIILVVKLISMKPFPFIILIVLFLSNSTSRQKSNLEDESDWVVFQEIKAKFPTSLCLFRNRERNQDPNLDCPDYSIAFDGFENEI